MAGTTAAAATNGATNNNNSSSLIRPHALCHVVLRTTSDNYKALVEWYLKFTGGTVTHSTPRLSFITYDYEHHRLAIMIDPEATPRPAKGPAQVGVHHVAFGFKELRDLATSYEQKKAMGILPVWCINHGMSTSMYYEDLDGNRNELQVDNFDTAEEAVAFMQSAEFEENPIGVDFDPEEFVAKIKEGIDPSVIKQRPNIGRRAQR